MAVNSFEKQVALALQRTVDLSKLPDQENQSAFDGRDQLPALDIYIRHVSHHFQASESMLVVALVYIDRFCGLTGRELSPKNVHRIFLTAYLCAVKFHEDRFYRNTYYAQAGGLHIKELNNLERLFLKRVDFALSVQPNIYNEYLRAIMTVNQAEKVTPTLECIEPAQDEAKKEVRRSCSDASTAIGTTASEMSALSSDDTSNRNLYTPRSGRTSTRGSYRSERFCNQMQPITSGDEAESESGNEGLAVVHEENEHDVSDEDSFLEDEIDQHGTDHIDAFHDSDHDSGSESDASFCSESELDDDDDDDDEDDETLEVIEEEDEDETLDVCDDMAIELGIENGETVEIEEVDIEMSCDESDDDDEEEEIQLDEVVDVMLDDVEMEIAMESQDFNPVLLF